jgi:phage antirepressor protein
VASDVCEALGLKQVTRALRTCKAGVTKCKVSSGGEMREVNIINEKAIYKLAFKSRKKEAEEFQDWVVDIIKELREAAGLEGFQAFRMFSKERQKAAMQAIHNNIPKPSKKDYIKANVIADKAVSNKYGYKKMVKKNDMTPSMQKDRVKVLDDVVDLLIAKERFGLDISVSETIYKHITH